MVKVRSSRRAASLKPTDYDHEIGLVNHDEAENDSRSTLTESAVGTRRASTISRLVSLVGDGERDDAAQAEGSGTQDESVPQAQQNGTIADVSEQDENQLQPEESLPHPSMQPSIEVQGKYTAPFQTVPAIIWR